MVPAAAVARYHLHGVNRDAVSLGFNGRVVVIFGFGPGSPEDQGEVAPCVCPNCHNQVFLHHVRSKKSVRLYFVPVVPYGTDDYLVCPVCSRGLQVSDAQLRHLRSMSAVTASFRAGRLPQTRYMAQVEGFWRQLGLNPAGQQPLTRPYVIFYCGVAGADLGFCRLVEPGGDLRSWLR